MVEQIERPPAEAASGGPAARPKGNVASGQSTEATRPGHARRRLRAVWPWAVAAVAVAAAAALWAAGSTRAKDRSPQEILEDMRRGAREREIARMITTLRDVRSAKVLLRDGIPAGASVTLELCEGVVLRPETASAVAGLVASAAPGLDPHDVVVVDSRDPARTHRLSPDSEVAYDGAAVLRLRRDVERALADKLRSLFAGMSIECVAVVSAELDLDRISERVVELDPQRKGEVILSEERGPPSEGGRARGETRKIEAEVGRITREISRSPKGLASVKASVVLFDRIVQKDDGTWKYEPIAEKDLDDYAALAARALGLGEEDMKKKPIEVKHLKSPWAKPPVSEAEPVAVGPLAWAAGGVLAGGLLLVAFALGRMIRRRRAANVPTPPEPARAEGEPEPELSPAEKLKAEVAHAAGEDIERTASILRRWIVREG